MYWQPDILGDGFHATELSMPQAGGTPRIATLIRYRDPDGTAPTDHNGGHRQAVLFLHGWSDYFFNVELARFFTRLGVAFYALDMHNHGRSLRDGDLGGYVKSLNDYDEEVLLAHTCVMADMTGTEPAGPPASLALMGHSTGGLVAALWAAKHPALVSQLILNSPWLDIHGGSPVRRAALPVVRPLATLLPERRMPLPERNFYWRSISDEALGEWRVDAVLRPPKAFPIRAGWMNAILTGQAQVAKGLNLRMPVMVMLSARSLNGPVWTADMRRADVVLDVRALATRSLSLGPRVTIERIDGGLHDVLLSAKAVREDAYARLAQWIRGYMLAD
jgi:alpha-beta hydrolase superfamily lysophospholipase